LLSQKRNTHLTLLKIDNDYVNKPVENLNELTRDESMCNHTFIKKGIVMNSRDEYLVALRPEIPGARIDENMSDEERFQNMTLRPIAKLQNDLLIAVFRNYIKKHKNVFCGLTANKRIDYIENAVNRDQKFRSSLKGILMGLFTIVEFEHYISNSSALNKRMMNLVRERLISNIQLFEKPAIEL
jgi:hypothetical protein